MTKQKRILMALGVVALLALIAYLASGPKATSKTGPSLPAGIPGEERIKAFEDARKVNEGINAVNAASQSPIEDVQRTLRTVEEINRLNRINQEMQQRVPPVHSTPPNPDANR